MSTTRIAPVDVRHDGANTLTVTWNDGRVTTYPHALLRSRCPCAVCNQAREQADTGLRLMDKGPIVDTTIVEMRWVGRYGLALRWGDGHGSGIFTYQFLLELAAPIQNSQIA